MDFQRAEGKVTELLPLLQTSRSRYDVDHENYWRLPGWEELNADLFARLPLVRRIAEQAHASVVEQLVENNRMYHSPWDECYDGCLELLGALQSSAEAEAILGPSGPQLAAQDLHPWVWHAAVDLWDAKHLRPAVLDA